MPLLMLMVEWDDGRSQFAALNMSKAIFGGIFRAAQADKADKGGGMTFGAEIKGLGDEAVRMPKLGLNVLEGDTLIRVIPGPVPAADAKTIDVARAVLKKL